MTTAAGTSGAVREITQDDVVAFLSEPSSYPEQPAAVQLHETHISRVFVTDRFAYKLKKRLRFEFLDYSTLDLRRAACETEVRLNRRLAPDVYLGVVPVTLDRRGKFHLGAKSPPTDVAIEWLVKMRRLDESRSLQSRLIARALEPRDVDLLATWLANHYSQLPPVAQRTEEYRASRERLIGANEDELRRPLHGLDPLVVRRTHAAQRRLLRWHADWFDHRVCDGRIVEGHGDLRPEHIFLSPQPAIIDCIEFNSEFRRLDVLDELGFLAMECEVTPECPGAAATQSVCPRAVGARILERYAAVSGDRWPAELLAFYKSYRACVRAKVSVLRAEQVDEPQRGLAFARGRRYLQFADEYARGFDRPFVVVMLGLSGSGKSTLAAALAEEMDAELLQTDALRREAIPTTDRYSPANREHVYELLFERAERLVSARLSVVLDGTFQSADLRRRAVRLAQSCSATCVLVQCECPDDVAHERILSRQESGSNSDATIEVRRDQCLEPAPDLAEATLLVDTTKSVPELTSLIKSRWAVGSG